MKIPDMLKKVEQFIDSDKNKQREQKDSIKHILKKLKKKHSSIKEKLATEKNPEKQEKIEKELDIIFVQRKKGLKELKKLMKS